MAEAVAEFYDTSGRLQVSATLTPPFVFRQKLVFGPYSGVPQGPNYDGYLPEPIERCSFNYPSIDIPMVAVSGTKRACNFVKRDDGTYSFLGTSTGTATVYLFGPHDGISKAGNGKPNVEIYDFYTNRLIFDALSRPMTIVGSLVTDLINPTYNYYPSDRDYAVLVQNPGLASRNTGDGNNQVGVGGAYASGGQWGLQALYYEAARGGVGPASAATITQGYCVAVDVTAI